MKQLFVLEGLTRPKQVQGLLATVEEIPRQAPGALTGTLSKIVTRGGSSTADASALEASALFVDVAWIHEHGDRALSQLRRAHPTLTVIITGDAESDGHATRFTELGFDGHTANLNLSDLLGLTENRVRLESDVLARYARRTTLIVGPPEVRAAVAQELRDGGVAVAEASSAREGLAALRKQPIRTALVAMDGWTSDESPGAFIDSALAYYPRLRVGPLEATTAATQRVEALHAYSLANIDPYPLGTTFGSTRTLRVQWMDEVKREPWVAQWNRHPGLARLCTEHLGPDAEDADVVVGFGECPQTRRADAVFVTVNNPGEVDDASIADLAREIDRQRVERDLRRGIAQIGDAESQQRAILDGLPTPALVITGDGNVIFANRAAEELLEQDTQALCESDIGEAILAHPEELQLTRTSGAPVTVEVRRFKASDSAPVQVVVLYDVSARHEASQIRDQLAHADRLVAVGQLAAGVAHEVNNPAAFVSANLETMRRHVKVLRKSFAQRLRQGQEATRISRPSGGLTGAFSSREVMTALDELDEMISDNLDGMERIRSIVKDLRSFSRLGDDLVEEVDLNGVVQIACNLAFNEIRHRARLVKDLGRVPAVFGDQGKLTQVVTNLLINAAHAVQSGKVQDNQIKVTTRTLETGEVELRVEDTGRGIPPETLPRIFEPFFTTKPRDKGTGLGLSLCADIVRKHNGQITAESTLGEGTCFFVRLPQADLQELHGDEDSHPDAPPEEEDLIRVLIIDDEPALLRSYRRMLRGDFNVTIAEGGLEAQRMIEADQSFDVIICDLMMPDLDGPSVYDWMKTNHPELCRRIIFCTGGAFTEATRAFLDEIQRPVLEKPISRADLTMHIERVAEDFAPTDTRPPLSPRFLN